jgi:hypothetical protein
MGTVCATAGFEQKTSARKKIAGVAVRAKEKDKPKRRASRGTFMMNISVPPEIEFMSGSSQLLPRKTL